MPNPIQDLMSTPPEELLEELSRIKERERLVAQERELLERVLEILIESGGDVADWLTDPARGLIAFGPLRSQILRVMESRPKQIAWLPKEVHRQLVNHGNTKATLDNVRVTMRRMVVDQELLQPNPPKPKFSLPKRAKASR